MRRGQAGFEIAYDSGGLANADTGEVDYAGGSPMYDATGSGLTNTVHASGGCYAIETTYSNEAHLHLKDENNVNTVLSEFWFRDKVYWKHATAFDPSFGSIIGFFGPSNNRDGGALHVTVTSAGLLRVQINWGGSATVLATAASNALSLNTMHRIDGYVLLANSGGRVRLSVDGVEVIDFTGDTLPGTEFFDRVIFWGPNSGSVIHDDFELNDATGSVNNAAPANGYIVALVPTDSNISERPPNDATYVEVTSGNRLETGINTLLASITGDGALALYLRVKATGSSQTSIQPSIKLGGIRYDSPTQVISTSFKHYRYIWNRNPQTNGAWELGDVNGLLFGFEAIGGTVRCSQALLEIDGTGGSACDSITVDPVDPPAPWDGDDITPPGAPGLPNVNFRTVTNIKMAATDPGGFADATFREPLKPNEGSTIDAFEDLVVYARDNANPAVITSTVVYQGRVEPSRRVSSPGEMWAEYGAFGWIRNAIDDQPWWGRVQHLVKDEFVGYAGGSLTAGQGGYCHKLTPDFDSVGDTVPEPIFRLSLPPGSNLGILGGDWWQLDYSLDPYAPGVKLSDLYFRWSVSQVLSGCRFEIWAYVGIGAFGSPSLIYSQDWNAVTDFVVSGLTIPANTWRVIIRPVAFTLPRSSIPEPGITLKISSWPPSGALFVFHGTALTGATARSVRASDVINRIVLDACPALNPTSIATTPQIVTGFTQDQAAPPRDSFDTLCLLADGDYTYRVREKVSTKYKFESYYRPTSVKYATNPGPGPIAHVELSLESDVSWLRNRVVVNYQDPKGRPKTYIATGSVAELTAKNLTRTLTINAGRLRGLGGKTSDQNAVLIAETALEDHSRPVRRGTIRVIDRQVRDLTTTTDLLVEWLMFSPGELIRVTDTQIGGSPGTSINDGDVWRIHRAEVTLDETIEATLTVGQGTDRINELVARLQVRDQAA